MRLRKDAGLASNKIFQYILGWYFKVDRSELNSVSCQSRHIFQIPYTQLIILLQKSRQQSETDQN